MPLPAVPLVQTRVDASMMPVSRQSTRRRYSSNSLEGQRGTLRATKETLHGDLGIRDRIRHFTLAWFTCTMSTGGIALVLSQTPHRFHGLQVIGDIVFILDIVLFLLFCSALTARFTLFPSTIKSCLTHPTESLFIPTFWISVVNIVSNTQQYGVPHTGHWLVVALRVLFWLYAAVTFAIAIGQYYFLFTGKPLTVQNMTPQWILPVFPIMLCGTLASLISPSQPPSQALPILIAGISFQGLGMMIAVFMYGPYISRLMTAGLPNPNTRPGMFIAVGPPSFTGLALLGISKELGRIYPSYTSISGVSNPTIIPDVFRILAVAVSVFLWATAFFFFSISLVSTLAGALSKQGMSFHLVWWSFVFPNVGFTICTINLGSALMSSAILWLGSVMTVLLIVLWLFVGCFHIRAVWRGDILWPGKDEDHDQ
jgi:C4-dicarboxylate transporter/malic acid transport protein